MRRGAFALLALAGCPAALPKVPDPPAAAKHADTPGLATCGGLDASACTRARGLIAAATALGNVQKELILDPTGSFAAGRGLERTPAGTWSPLPTACAKPRARDKSDVDATAIDFSFVGVAVDTTLVSADADLSKWFSAGGSAGAHKLRLVAIALVRDKDPQFFEASDDVAPESGQCSCGRATHFVGAVKMGGMLAYDLDVRDGEVHGKALEFVQARLATQGGLATETRVGGLEIDGLEAMLHAGPGDHARAHGVKLRVTNPVPIAYDVYPLGDVCKFAVPEPQVSPSPLDFGDVPYGEEATRLVHVVNRAPIDLSASFRNKLFEVPARGSADLVAKWAPEGDTIGCEAQTREEAIVFSPRDPKVPASPKQQTVRITERVRTGRGALTKRERVDTGERPAPDYAETSREWVCPHDYAVASCRAEERRCGGGECDAYVFTAATQGNGCRFGCQGPSSLVGAFGCRFDAVMECKLKCTP